MNYRTKSSQFDSDIFITPAQASHILNISIATLKKSIYQGKLQTYKTPGGHHRIRKSDLYGIKSVQFTDNHPDISESSSMFEIIKGLIEINERRLQFNKNHSINVAKIASEIARKIKLSAASLTRVQLAALLHDCGKFLLPEALINKTTPLTHEEYSIIKTHVICGADLVESMQPLHSLAEIVRQHHERYDGSGYPYGLKALEILEESRIIAVADAFDVMTTANSYKKSISLEEALNEIRNNASKQFDPVIVDCICELYLDKSQTERLMQT